MSNIARSRRWTGWLTRSASLIRPFPVLRCEELENRLAPATFTWSGAGIDNLWTTPGNWVGSVAPTGQAVNSEDLVFPNGVAKLTAQNNLTGGVFNSITIAGTGYTLAGNAITLGLPNTLGSGALVVNSGAINNTLAIDTRLGVSAGLVQTFTVNASADLTVTGKISGTTGTTLTKDGPGTLTFTNDNSGFTGSITVLSNAGSLVVTNPLALGTTTAGTTINAGSSLVVKNVAGPINEPVILNGLGAANDGALRNAGGTNVWAGPIELDSNVAVGATTGTLNITGQISDTAGGWTLFKEGVAEVQFNHAGGNTYRGQTIIDAGILTIGDPLALGAQGTLQNGTVVNQTLTGSGQLRLADPTGTGFTVLDEVLTLNGAGNDSPGVPGALTDTKGNNTWAGSVLLGSPAPNGSDVTVGAADGIDLTISGVVSSPNGGYSLIKQDLGRVILNNANTYFGFTDVRLGTLNVRDSRALGSTFSGTRVLDGGTLEMEVEAGNPAIPRFDAHNRDLWDDSVTHDPNKLLFTEPLDLNGMGHDSAGALRSLTGINAWDIGIVLNDQTSKAAIGVEADPRPGHPTPDSSYFVSDYSLTVLGVISTGQSFANGVSDFYKRGSGQLVLPTANTYIGQTFVQAGWITVENNNSLGAWVPSLGPTVQPATFVSGGAAVHVKTLSPASPPLNILENITLNGMGIDHPYSFISEKGALLNLGGLNTWVGDVKLSGPIGVGVEQVDPNSPSELSISGTISGSKTTQNFSFTASGDDQEFSQVIDTGATSGQIRIDYDMLDVPDDLRVYYPSRAEGGRLIYDSGLVSQTGTAIINFGGGTSTKIEIVMNEGGGEFGTFWSLDNVAITTSEGGGGLIKLGSKRLNLQGDGTYPGATEVREGTLRVQNDTALGQASSGSFATQQAYSQTTTTVAPGAVLEMNTGIPTRNGGVAAGVNVWYEQLQLNSPGQQIAVAGDLTPAPTNYSLTFNGQTTFPLLTSASAADVQNALNLLSSVRRSEVQTVQVLGTAGTFKLNYNGQVTGAIPVNATAAQVQKALNALPALGLPEVQTVNVVGTAGTFTLTFNGATTAPLAFDSTAGQVQAALNNLFTIGGANGSTTVTATPFGGGTQYTITFGGALSGADLPAMTSTGAGGANTAATTVRNGVGFVTVSATPVPPAPPTAGGMLYTVTFGGGVADQNLPQMTGVGNGPTVTVATVQDGLAGSVSVVESAVAGGGTKYAITFGGDLANTDVRQITVNANGGTSPTVTTDRQGSATQSEVQSYSVVPALASFTLTYRGQTTAPLPINATAKEMQDALNGLSLLVADNDDVPVRVTRTGNVFTMYLAPHAKDIAALVAAVVPVLPPATANAEVTVSGVTTVDGSPSNAPLVNVADDNAWRGPVSLATGTRIATAGGTRLSLLGSVGDAGNADPNGSDLVKRGMGELLLGGANTFRGTTWIDQSVVTAMNSQAFGATTAGTVVADGAQLQLQGSLTIAGEPLKVLGSGPGALPTFPQRWFNVGPAPTNNGVSGNNLPTSGRVTSIATDPTDPNVIFVATAGGGAWKTKDGGLSWVPLFDDQFMGRAAIYGGAVAVAPSDPRVVYFGTGEANGAPNGLPIPGQQDNVAGTGVYRSTDAGATWVLLTNADGSNPLFGQAVTKMIVDPEDADRVYVASGNSNLLNASATATPGIWRWTPTTDSLGGWFDLTGSPSPNRTNVKGGLNVPPRVAGPDDDYRIAFPQTNATWSDMLLVKRGVFPGGKSEWVLYAALGESTQKYYGGEGDWAILNGVYRTEDPDTLTANPTWWLGTGSIFPRALSNGPNPGPAGIQPVTLPDGRNGAFPVGPVQPPSPFIPPGRNGWIKLAGSIENFLPTTSNPFANLYQYGLINAHITVYASIAYPDWQPQKGELFDIEKSGWDGGINTTWAPTGSLPQQAYGTSVSTGGFFSNLIPGTGRYDSTLIVHDADPRSSAGAVLENNPNIVILGGKDSLFESTDGGTTWQVVTPDSKGNAPGAQYHALGWENSGGSAKLLTGSDGGIWSWDGSTFADLNTNLAVTQLNSVDPHPTDPGRAVAGSEDNGTQQFDNTQAWRRLDDAAGTNSGDVRYDPKNPQIMYAVRDGQLRKSVDGGLTWVKLRDVTDLAANPPLSPPFNADNTINTFPLVVDSVNTSRLLIGGNTPAVFPNALYESVNGGASFTNLQANVAVTAIGAATFQGPFVPDPAFTLVTDKLSNTYDPDTIYVTDGGSLRLTKNHGVSWVTRTPQINDVQFSVVFGGSLANRDVPLMTGAGVAGAYPSVTTRRNGSDFGSEIQGVEVTSTGVNGTFTLTFNGQTTAPLAYTASATQIQAALNALTSISGFLDSEVQQVQVTGTAGTFNLTFNGQTTIDLAVNSSAAAVQQALNSLTTIGPNGVTVTAVFDGTNNVATYTITFGGGALKNTNVPQLIGAGSSNGPTVAATTIRDGGAGSVAVTGGGIQTIRGTITDIAVDPSNRDTVYLTMNYSGDRAGPVLLRSTDAGRTWAGIAGNGATGLPNVPTSKVVIDPRTDTAYVGDDNGVWQLRNASTTDTFDWVRFGVGLPRVQVRDLVLNQSANTLTAGTYGRSMFQLFLTNYQPTSGGLREVSGSSVWTGPVTLTGDTTIGAEGSQNLQNGIAAATLNIIGTIDDPSGNNYKLIKVGNGTVTLSGSNVYSGQTLVQQGVLQVNNPHALGASVPTANTVVSDGAALELRTDLDSEPVTINGNGFLFNGHFTGALRNVSNNNVYSGPLTFGTSTTIGVNSGTSLTIGAKPGVLQGTGSITDAGANLGFDKELPGTLILASANTYGGLTRVVAGALQVQHAQALGGTAVGTTVLDGAQLQIANAAVGPLAGQPTVVTGEPLSLSGTGIFGTGALFDVGGDNTWDGPVLLAKNPNFLPATTPGNQVAFGVLNAADTLTIAGVVSEAVAGLGVIKVGPGRLTLAQADSYTGLTSVVAGIVRAQNSASLGGVGQGTVVAAGAALELDGGGGSLNVAEPLTINGDGIGGTGALNNVAGDNTQSGAVTLATNTTIAAVTGTTLTVSGLVQDPTPFPVPVARLRKAGQGTVVFPNANTYAGKTVVADGALRVANADALGVVRPEVQQVQVIATNGTFQLTFNGQITVSLPFNVPATGGTDPVDSLQNALNALPSIGGVGGSVTVTQVVGQGNVLYFVTFGGSLGNVNVPQMTATTTGGTSVIVTTLQDGSEGTTVNSGATLQVAGGISMADELVTINGKGFNNQGALNNYSDNNTWGVPLTLGGSSYIGTTNQGETLTFAAPITDNKAALNVDVVGPGEVAYAATGDNQYTGTTTVQQGLLTLNETGGRAVLGPLVVGTGAAAPAVARETQGDQIADAQPVTVGPNGTFDLNGQADTVGVLTVNDGAAFTGPAGQLTVAALNMTGGTVNIGGDGDVILNGNVTATSSANGPAHITGDGFVYLNGADRTFAVADGPQPVDLFIDSQFDTLGSERIIKTGAGRLALDATEFPNALSDQAGDVEVDPDANLGPVQLVGGSLSGTGHVGTIGGATAGSAAVGRVGPGVNWSATPAGILSSDSAVWGPATEFTVNLSNGAQQGGPTAGTDYDQLRVNGTINLGGATLDGVFGSGIQLGDRFTIITTTGGVTGRFAEPFGPGVVFIQGQKFSVDYSDPNKVILEKILANATIGVASSANPSMLHQPVTFTATVTPEAGAAGADLTAYTVTFTLDGTPYPAVSIDASGHAVFDPQAALGHDLAAGTHTLSAEFNGDPANFNTATATLTPDQTVLVPTIDALGSSPAGSPVFISTANSPSAQHTVTVTTTVHQELALSSWTVTVRNSSNVVVKTYTTTGVTPTGGQFPISVTWDGTNSSGAFVPDGSYTITASFTDKYGNTGSTEPISVEVVPLLTVTATSLSKGFGEAVPALTYTVSGLVNGDTAAGVLGGALTTVATAGSPAGNYAITQGSLHLTTQRYTLDFIPGTLTVTPAALTVTAAAATKVYGAALPPLTYTVSGLMNGDTAAVVTGALATAASVSSPVGDYAITQGGVTTNANYTINFVGNTLAVTPAPLTVTASNAVKVYGAALPPLTYTVSGLVNGDTAAVVTGAPGTTATAASPVGDYPITQGGVKSNANYTVNFVNATLAVTPAPLTIVIDNATRVFGTPNPTFTAKYQGLVNGDTPAAIGGLTLTTPATIDSVVGKYPIVADGVSTAKNYDVTVVPGTLTVTHLRSDSVTSIPASLAIGSGAGSPPLVNEFTLGGPEGLFRPAVSPFDPSVTFPAGFTGGVRTAAADFNGDGVSDLVVGTGPGMSTLVIVLDGKTRQELFRTQPFEAAFTGGVFVSTGDVNGDGAPDLVITPDEGGGPRARVFDGTDFHQIADFLGINDPNFRGGARAAIGDVNHDGYGDVVVAAGFGGGPRVSVWDGKGLVHGDQTNVFPDFFIFGGTDALTLRNGVFIAAGDVNGDGYADLVAGGGPGGGPRVLVVDGKGLVQNGSDSPTPVANFFAGDTNNRGGVRVTVKDIDGDDKQDVVVGAGENAGSTVTAYKGADLVSSATPPAAFAFDAFDDVTNGVYVG
jgi:autotransporter-associated beta strand protein